MNESVHDPLTDTLLRTLRKQNAALQLDLDNLQRQLLEQRQPSHLTSVALDTAREAVYLADEHGRLVYANEAFCRSLGYSATELSQLRIPDIDPTWTIERSTYLWSELRQKGALLFETKHRRQDGDVLSVEVSASHVEYGGQEYHLSLARVVTERARAKRALWESEQRCRHLFEHVSDVLLVVEVTAQGRFRGLEMNPAAAQAFCIPSGKFIGKFVDESIPKATADVLCDAYRTCVASDMACDEELALDLPGGRRHYHATLIPTRDSSGHIDKIAVTARDVSAHKQSEALLTARLELEAKFRGLAESSLHVICGYDRQCRLTYANSGLSERLGRHLQDLLGKTPTEHTVDPQYAKYQTLIAAVIDTGTEREFEMIVRRTSGEARHHHIRIMPERGFQGDIVGALALGLDVTDRREAEQRLHASEQAFRAVVEHSPDYIARYDLDYRRVYANPALLKLMNRRADEVIGTTPAELSMFVDVQQYMDHLQRVAETGHEVTGEVLLHDLSGRVRWGHMRIVPEFAPDGEVTSMLAISRDIDELKRSEQLFRTLTENFPDFLARFDSEGRYLYVNPGLAQAFGMPQESFLGKTQPEMAPNNEAGLHQQLEQAVRQAFANGQPNEVEARLLTCHGACVFEVRYVPEKDAEGNIVSVLGIAHDVTRLRAIECALRDSERAFRTLAENAPDPIIRYDRNCRRTYVNPEFERVSGATAGELLGQRAGRIDGVPPEVARRFRAKLKKIMASGVIAKFELAWTHEGKAQCWYVHAVPENDAHGIVQGALTVWRDISERKEAEQRLCESYDLLRELTSRRETAREEERKRIARELHDELGQQLTALRMGTSTLRIRFGHGNPELAAHVQKILALSDNTMQVVRDAVASLRPAVLNAGIVAALEWLAAEFSRNGQMACRLRVPQDNMTIAEEQAIALFRIVQEALTNVARHAEAKHVSITLEHKGSDCLLEVRDDGKGFDPVAVGRQSFGIVGMRERVLMLGGEINVASSPGCGTSLGVRFRIRHAPITS
ncbi:PAS domain-containing protein [Paraburkholderia fungorum]|uniref:PAS domain-containing sensor histidine kinase n=1 Tax=Paraburkholderia fungorum TaxID=134537 RepID=UPI0038BBF1C9